MKLNGWEKFQVVFGTWFLITGVVDWTGGSALRGTVSVTLGATMIGVSLMDARGRARRPVDDED